MTPEDRSCLAYHLRAIADILDGTATAPGQLPLPLAPSAPPVPVSALASVDWPALIAWAAVEARRRTGLTVDEVVDGYLPGAVLTVSERREVSRRLKDARWFESTRKGPEGKVGVLKPAEIRMHFAAPKAA